MRGLGERGCLPVGTLRAPTVWDGAGGRAGESGLELTVARSPLNPTQQGPL